MEYNTTREKLLLPEYGRNIQQMARQAVSIENRDDRRAYAQLIIHLMRNLNPQAKNNPDNERKLWDHLALMTDYQLDIDYPYEIQHQEEKTEAPKVAYPAHGIRMRHYGNIIERWIKLVSEMEGGPEREELTLFLANRMKRHLVEWKGDGVSDEKVAYDLENLSDGALKIDVRKHRLSEFKKTQQSNQNQKKK